MNADAEYHGWIVFDLSRGLHVRDLVDPDLARPMAVCRVGASLSEIVKILVECPGARNVYVIDERGRLQGQVSLSAISEILLFDDQPSRVYLRLIRAITARTAEDIMEPVDVAVREDESLEQVLRKLVPTREEECPVVDEGGHLIGCLTVVDILGRVLLSDE